MMKDKNIGEFMTMSLQQKYAAQIEEFVAVCNRLAQLHYVTSSGGNLAWKLEENLILITPTKMYKGSIKTEDVVFVDMKGAVVEGKHHPTGEVPMYLRFFGRRPDIQSVIHCHPAAACAVSVLKGKNWLMRPFLPEPSIEVGPVPLVPYAEPLTDQLAENFEPFLQRYDAFIMANHGLVTMSRKGIMEAFNMTDILEATAQSVLIALSAGDVNELDRQAVADLNKTMKTRNLPLFGAPGVNNSLEELYFD
jgi:ribulose-5-phosphate 4-epimerase/fuculose-1-phosphate aldolase